MNQVETYIMKTLGELSRDWDYSDPITANTGLFTQLGLESLDAVILATSIQEHYQCAMPFPQLFAEVGERQEDLTVGELIDFVQRHVPGQTAVNGFTANGSAH
jgi:acyl carrier protein